MFSSRLHLNLKLFQYFFRPFLYKCSPEVPLFNKPALSPALLLPRVLYFQWLGGLLFLCSFVLLNVNTIALIVAFLSLYVPNNVCREHRTELFFGVCVLRWALLLERSVLLAHGQVYRHVLGRGLRSVPVNCPVSLVFGVLSVNALHASHAREGRRGRAEVFLTRAERARWVILVPIPCCDVSIEVFVAE